MRFRELKIALAALIAAGFASRVDEATADGPQPFETLHAMIKTQPGESRYRQIDWLTSVWEARRKAAEEGKPIFIWAGSGGGPVGVC